MKVSINKQRSAAVALAIGLVMVPGVSMAQSNGNGYDNNTSSQDKKFLKDLGQDSNFEIQSAQLALQKSQSADVKEYARMVSHDHEQMKSEIAAATRAAGTTPVSSGDMTVSDHAELLKLKALSGNSFDEAYIKGLIKGNEDIQTEEKTEASSSSLAPVKRLAQRSADTDTKHADKAKQLARAHNIQG